MHQGIPAISSVAQAVRLLTASRRFALFRGISRTTRGPHQVAHIACGLRGSLQRFGEFLRWCHPVEGLSRASVELVGGEVEIVLGECCYVGAFGEVLA